MRNWVDAVIEYVAPVTAARRARARAVLQLARSYDAAVVNRRTKGWRTDGGTANAEILGGVTTIRQRARDLCRNNGIARRAVGVMVRNLVGTGILADFANERTQRVWNDSLAEMDPSGQSDFYGQQALIARSLRESGEVLVRFKHRPSSWGLRVPLQLQVLEADHLDHYKTCPVENGGYVIAGVEHDSEGRRVAYWLYPEHPGEVLPTKSFRSVRVPANEILHIFEVERPAQVRGVSSLVAAMLRLRDLDEFSDAEMVRKKIEACFTVFVKSDDDARTIADTTTETTAGKARRLDKIAPGLINYLRHGEEVQFAAPVANGGYTEFVHESKLDICTALETPYELATGDLSRVNYSSIRAGLIEFRGRVRQVQFLTLRKQLLAPVATRWLEVAYACGAVRRSPDDHAVRWTMPRFEWVDPLKEIQAIKEELKLRGLSWREFLRERGLDPDSHLADLEASDEALNQLDLTLDQLVASPAPAAPAASNASDDGAAASGDDAKPKQGD